MSDPQKPYNLSRNQDERVARANRLMNKLPGGKYKKAVYPVLSMLAVSFGIPLPPGVLEIAAGAVAAGVAYLVPNE